MSDLKAPLILLSCSVAVRESLGRHLLLPLDLLNVVVWCDGHGTFQLIKSVSQCMILLKAMDKKDSPPPNESNVLEMPNFDCDTVLREWGKVEFEGIHCHGNIGTDWCLIGS